MTKKRWFMVGMPSFVLFVAILCMVAACGVKENNFNLNFNVDEEVIVVSANKNSDIKMPEDPEKTGYSFNGWYLDQGEWEQPFSSNTIKEGNISTDTNIYAKFDIINYTINYIDTKDAINNNPTSYNIESSDITLEKISVDGYFFAGWSNGTDIVTKIPKGSTENVNLTAQWKEVDKIFYNDSIKAIKDTQSIDVDLFEAVCYDSNGNEYEISLEVTGTAVAGNKISVTLFVSGNNDIDNVVIENIEIYGTPVIESSYVDEIYSNVDLNTIFKAKDSFNKNLQVFISIVEGSLEDGETLKIKVTTTDDLQNEALKEFTFKVYTSPTEIFSSWDNGVITGLTDYGKTLTNILIPNKIEEIDITGIASQAFSGCENLECVIIPKGIINVGENIFSNCTNLTICCEDSNKQTGWSTSWNSSNLPVIWDFIGNKIFYNTVSAIKDTQNINLALFNANCFDKRGNKIEISLTISKEVVAGNKISVILSSLDNNVESAVVDDIKVYGTPTIESIYTNEIFSNVNYVQAFTAEDSFGESLTTNIESTEGGFLLGGIIKIKVTAKDSLGNEAEKNYEFRVVTPRSAFYFSYISDKEIGISSLTTEGKRLNTIIIPSMIGEKKVTEIDQAFQNTNISYCYIPDSVRSIADYAFLGCRNLRYIVIPKSVTGMGADPFSECHKNLRIYCEFESEEASTWNMDICNGDKANFIWNFQRNKIYYDESIDSVKAGINFYQVDCFEAFCLDENGVQLDVSVRATYGCFLTGEAGDIVSIDLGVINSEIEEVKITDIYVYGTPIIETPYDKEIYSDVKLNEAFTAKDSFDGALTVKVTTVSGSLTESDTIVVKVTATDKVGNVAENTYSFTVVAR